MAPKQVRQPRLTPEQLKANRAKRDKQRREKMTKAQKDKYNENRREKYNRIRPPGFGRRRDLRDTEGNSGRLTET